MRKWFKIVLAAMLSAGTLMLSSCIENVEPEGIAKLRGAKADLLTAQIAIQAANAAKIEADAALVAAKAKIKEAVAKQEEAKALKLGYEAELKKLEVDLESGLAAEKLKAELAKLEADAQRAAAELEEELLRAKTALVLAQQAYDTAMKDLKAAKLSLSDGQKAYLAEFVMKVDAKQADVDGLTSQLELAGEDLAAAVSTLDEAMADKIKKRLAERDVAKAKAYLESLQETAAKLEEALKLDDQVKSWVAMQESIEAELKAIESESATDIEGNEKYAELKNQADELRDLISEIGEYTGLSFNETSGKFSIVPIGPKESWLVPEAYVKAPVDEDGYQLFGEDFQIREGALSFRYADTGAADSYFDDVIEAYSYVDEELYDKQIEMMKDIVESMQKNAESDLAKYDAAVAAYKSGDVYAYLKEYGTVPEDFDPKELADEYNAALKAFEEALNTFETETEKYAQDPITEAQLEIEKKAATELDAAEYAWVKAYQDAHSARRDANVARQNAENKMTRADRAHGYVVDEVTAVTGYSTIAAMQTRLDELKAIPEADRTERQKAEIASLEANIEKLEAADEALADAQEEYDNVLIAYNKAYDTYTAATDTADDIYEKAKRDINDAKQDALDDLDVENTNPKMNGQYSQYLREKVSDSVIALKTLLANDLRNYAVADYTMETVRYKPEHYGDITFSVPSFGADEDLTALKAIEVKDFVDPEYFLEDTVTDLAKDLLTITVSVSVQSEGFFDNKNFDYSAATEDFPLSLPDGDEFMKFLEESCDDAKKQFVQEQIAKGRSPRKVEVQVQNASAYADYYWAQMDIQSLEAQKENLPKLAEFIEGIKAAKKVYEDFKAEKFGEIDEMIAKVETDWAVIADELAKFEEAEEAAQLKKDALNLKLSVIVDAIEYWVEDKTEGTIKDFDTFVKQLEDFAEGIAKDIPEAEDDVIIAEDALENLYASETNAKDLAQEVYDKIAEKLSKASAELEAASAELEAAMTAVKAIE